MRAKNGRCFLHEAMKINYRFGGAGLTSQILDQVLLAGSYLFAIDDQQQTVKNWIEIWTRKANRLEIGTPLVWWCPTKFDSVASSIYQANKQCVEKRSIAKHGPALLT